MTHCSGRSNGSSAGDLVVCDVCLFVRRGRVDCASVAAAVSRKIAKTLMKRCTSFDLHIMRMIVCGRGLGLKAPTPGLPLNKLRMHDGRIKLCNMNEDQVSKKANRNVIFLIH